MESARELLLARNNEGATAFDVARSRGNQKIMRVLIETYANHQPLREIILRSSFNGAIHEQDGTCASLVDLSLGKLTFEHLCTLLQSVDAVFFLEQDHIGAFPLHHVTGKPMAPLAILRTVVDKYPGALRARDADGLLPLHYACRAGTTVETLRYLVELGGAETIRSKDFRGRLPFHYLCASTNPTFDAVQFLVTLFPASVSMPSPNGDLPVALAARSGSLSVINFLMRSRPIIRARKENICGELHTVLIDNE